MNNALSLQYAMQLKQNPISTISFIIQHALNLLPSCCFYCILITTLC